MVGVAVSRHILHGAKEDDNETLNPIVTRSRQRKICAELCMAGLGGNPCGEDCVDLVPTDMPVQFHQENSTINYSIHTRHGACDLLCDNNLGYPLCGCSFDSTKTTDFERGTWPQVLHSKHWGIRLQPLEHSTMPFPLTDEQQESIKEDFWRKWKFPSCVYAYEIQTIQAACSEITSISFQLCYKVLRDPITSLLPLIQEGTARKVTVVCFLIPAFIEGLKQMSWVINGSPHCLDRILKFRAFFWGMKPIH
ncbi:uncharacterized protein isoform X3 [Leptinotarsa decemlineata]